MSPGERGGDGQSEEHLTSTEKLDAGGKPIWEPIPGNTTRGGFQGPNTFRDGDHDNDFIGRRGELKKIIGGQGGGGAGSRLDSYWCDGLFPGLPPTVSDSRGGGGGGGGGALEILSLGNVEFKSTAMIVAGGGKGGYGERTSGNKPRGGGGGGGSGGGVRIMTATNFILPFGGGTPSIIVTGGDGANTTPYSSGGAGGHGIVQIQVPLGRSYYDEGITVSPPEARIPSALTPSELSSRSAGQSVWINLGVGVFRDHGKGPTFDFVGLDEQGKVITNPDGRIPEPDLSDIRVDTLPVIDPLTGRVIIHGRSDAISRNAWVRVEFQAADALSPDKDEINPQTVSAWSPSIAIANGRQFIRFRVTMEIARSIEFPLGADSQKVAVRLVNLRFTF